MNTAVESPVSHAPTLVDVEGIRLDELLSALASASRSHGGRSRLRVLPYSVHRSLDAFRASHVPDAQLESPAFLTWYFEDYPVLFQRSEDGPLTIDSSRYDKRYGRGLAERVVGRLKATGNWDARDLCTYEPPPVALWEIMGALALLLTAAFLLASKFRF